MFVAVMWMALAIHQQAQAAPPQGCGVNLAAPEIQAAINWTPTVPEGWPWEHDPQSFDPGKGNYVGTATSRAYAFTTVNTAQTTDDTVVRNYKDGRNVCTACPGPITSVRYQWQGDHVAMLDPPPAWR